MTLRLESEWDLAVKLNHITVDHITVVWTTSFDQVDLNVITLYYFNACRIKISRLVQIKLFTKIASKIFLLPIFSRSTSVTVVPWGSRQEP